MFTVDGHTNMRLFCFTPGGLFKKSLQSYKSLASIYLPYSHCYKLWRLNILNCYYHPPENHITHLFDISLNFMFYLFILRYH